jgi:hypothetical protein
VSGLTILPRLDARRTQVQGIIDGFPQLNRSYVMAKAPRTEAERKATPRPVAPKGVNFTAPKGQLRSLERGTATNSKKNPGKRPKKGG